MMVDQITALERARNHALSTHGCGSIGDMSVEPSDGNYRVRLVELPGRDAGRTYEVDIDAVSLDVRDSNVSNTVEGYYDGLVTGFVDGAQARRAASDAIAGYEHYDKQGRFSVQLQKDTYIVTFPPSASGNSDTCGADYAYQIFVNARTGTVDKILVAS